jgi:S1-C subfamily serine protease
MLALFAASSLFFSVTCRAVDLTAGGADSNPQQPTANSQQPATTAAAEPAEDPDIELATRLERGFTKLAKRVAPAVVSLKVHVKQGSWLEELRRMSDQFGPLSPQRDFEGSGVIIDPAGMIATNEHVVRGADSIQVTFSDGRVCPATVCGTDPRSDLAVIRIGGDDAPKNLQSAVLNDSDAVQVGQWVIAVGNPFGLSHTFTLGIVSARGRSMRENSFNNDVFYGNLIQTDAAINPGNSGGALFDMRGKLIGINTMIYSRTGISQGFGFAIPSNHLAKRMALLKTGREIEYGWLGIQLQDLDPAKRVFNVPENKGVVIEGVIPNTPADRAGLQPMMVILSFDGHRVLNKEDLIATVNETPVGRNVKLSAIDKQGKLVEVSVRVSKRNAELVQSNQSSQSNQASRFGHLLPGDAPEPVDLDAAAESIDKPTDKPPLPASRNTALWRGMQVKELPPDDGAKRGGRIEVVRVKKGSPADRAGLFEGAVIVELKSANAPAVQKVETLDDFARATHAAAGPVMLNTTADGFITIDEK